MDSKLKDIHEHIKEYGFVVLGRSIYSATFSEQLNPYSNRLCVIDATHGIELIIKARIAQEHPLLIFKDIPTNQEKYKLLDFEQLYDQGKTYSYSELPNILWATTGYKIKNIKKYKDFGKLRNGLMHFAVLKDNLAHETLLFVFEFVDYIIQDFWGENLIKYAEEFDPAIITDGYLMDRIQGLRIHPNTKRYIKTRDNTAKE